MYDLLIEGLWYLFKWVISAFAEAMYTFIGHLLDAIPEMKMFSSTLETLTEVISGVNNFVPVTECCFLFSIYCQILFILSIYRWTTKAIPFIGG
jgi:hypothetical protein